MRGPKVAAAVAEFMMDWRGTMVQAFGKASTLGGPMVRMLRWAVFAVACWALSGCQTLSGAANSVGSAVSSGWDSLFGSGGVVAAAEVKPTEGNHVSGKVEFRQSGSTVHVKVDLVGLAPNSEHGFHVHER